MSRYRNMGRAHLLSTADLVNPSACPGSRVDGFRCALPILRLGLWIRGKKNAGAFAPASSCIFRWNAGSERVAHAQVGATRFHPVGGLAEGIDTVACDQVLLGNRGLLVEDVEQVEEELELRSEEHTSELQSLMRISYAVFCLKKKKYMNSNH